MTTLVDDNDSIIVYSDNWIGGGSLAEYQNTAHGTNTTGATARFTFTGTSVVVHGTIVGSVTSSYSVDGSDPSFYTSPSVVSSLYRQTYFKSPTLRDGTHELVITVESGSAEFWLDYIEYTPSTASTSTPISSAATSFPSSAETFTSSPTASSLPPVTTVEPPTSSGSAFPTTSGLPGSTLSTSSVPSGATSAGSSSAIASSSSAAASSQASTTTISSGGWTTSATSQAASSSSSAAAQPVPTQSVLLTIIDDTDPQLAWSKGWVTGGQPPYEYNATTHGTRTTGAKVTLQFSGTSVAVFGTVEGYSNSTYQLDDQPAVSFVAPYVSTKIFQQRYFQSPVLDNSAHTLVITVSDAATSYWIDYLEYTTVNGSSSVSSVTAFGAVSSTSTSNAVASTGLDSSLNSSRASSSHSALIGGTVGGILGGLALLCCVFLLLRRRRAHHPRIRDLLDDDNSVGEGKHVASAGPFHANLPGAIAGLHTDSASSSISAEPDQSSTTRLDTSMTPAVDRPRLSVVNAVDEDEAALVITPFTDPGAGGDDESSRQDGKAARAAARRRLTSEPRVHEDGGVRLAAAGEIPEEMDELPPVYRNYAQ